MELDEYQNGTDSTAIYRGMIKDDIGRLQYAVTGLVGEAGEVANEAKRIMTKDGGLRDPIRMDLLAEELGDVLWYCAALARELGRPLEQIANDNLTKLQHRHGRSDEVTSDVPRRRDIITETTQGVEDGAS